ncbi:MAG: hypothetical protein L0209_01660, partial [candidate division Zixibacteria bacterium]|nr:hypothetical protein [candidate division Zixibacteria bacterium]
KKLSKNLGVKTFPVFITNASGDEVRELRTYKKILLLTKEDVCELCRRGERNESIQETLKFLFTKTIGLPDYDFESRLPLHPDATVSIYLEYKPKDRSV